MKPPASLPPRPWKARDSRVLDANGTELFLVHNVDSWQQDLVAQWLVSLVNDHDVPPRVLAAEQRREFREQLTRTSLGCACGHMLAHHRADDWDRSGNPIGRVCLSAGCDCGAES